MKELNNDVVDVTNENKKFCKTIEEQTVEIKKLKEDIIDYVLEKDNKIDQLQKELNHMKAVAEGAIGLCDLSDKTDYDLYNAQKHPMYPIHWGGWDKENTQEEVISDLALRVAKLEEQLKYTQKIIFKD